MSSSLRFKLLAALVLITSISLFIVGFANYKLSRDRLIQQLEEQSLSTVKNSAQNLYDFLSIRLAEIELISRMSVMKQGTLKEQLDFLNQELRAGGERYDSMGIADLAGNLTLTTGEVLNIRGEKYYTDAMSGKTSISDPYFSNKGDYIISITVPVFNDRKQLISIVDISLDAAATFRQHLVPPLLNGRNLLINREGLMLYNTQPSLILKRNLFTTLADKAPEFKEMLSHDSGSFNVTFDENEMHLFYTRVPKLDWYLAYSVPKSTFEAPAEPLLWTTVGLIVFTELVLSCLIYWTAYSLIIKRILQILHVTEAVADGDFYMKPLFFKSKDELGALAHSVNGMIENLRELFEPFEAFIRHNQYAMIVIDPCFTVLHFNQRAEEMLGYSYADVVKKATPALWLDHGQLQDRAARYSAELNEHVPADSTALVIKSLRRRREDTEWIWRRRDGSRLYVESNISVITHPDGSLKGYVCIARDVSEIKESTATKERLLAIMESAHDIILTFDRKGNILYMNQAGKKYCEIGDEELAVRRHFSHYVEILCSVDFDEGLALAVKQGFWEFEAEFLTRNNRALFMSLIIVPHITTEGSAYYYSAITRDITDQKRSQEELIRAKREADEANQAKSMFLARMSHEIRTPLNGIMGLTYLLERTGMSALQKDYVGKIASSSQALSQIINDILDFSKMEADKLTFERIPFQLAETLDRICETLSVLLGNKPIEFICSVDPQVPSTLVGDPLRIYQILLNLTSNAVKFTEEGSITVRIGVEESGQESGQDEVLLAITVSDTGIGIPESQLTKLFQPFAQADGSTSRRFGGTGLGLVICKNLIEQMGGSLDVCSEPGAGSEFRMRIPFELCAQQETAAPLLPVKALVAEDEPALRETLVNMLHSICEEAAGVSSWTEALKAAGVIPLDLLILDMEAPDMYGIEAWLEMKFICDRHNIRTILYTSLAGHDALAQLPEEARPDAVLVKPVSLRALQHAIDTVTAAGAVDSVEQTTEGKQAKAENEERILIVEDNEINQIVARSLLENRGYAVQVANNGFEAINQLYNGACSLILMDIHMPVLDGIETTVLIRQFPELRSIPIIALTADSTNEQRKACLQAGMNDAIAKPIHPDSLFEVIDRYLAKDKQTPEDYPKNLPDTAPQRPHFEACLDTGQALERLGGREYLYRHMLDKFHDQFTDAVPQLQSMIQSNRYPEALRALHTLRGAAGNISANRVLQTASELETALANAAESEGPALLLKLQTFADEMSELFQAIEMMKTR